MFDSDYTKLPNKIFRIGLGPFELAAFAALLTFGGANNRGLFPSHRALCRLAGMSGAQMDRALGKLRAAGVITWDRGKRGIANSYYILPCGTWCDQRSDLTQRSLQSSEVTSIRGQGDLTQRSPVTSIRGTNHTQLNQTKEPEEEFTDPETAKAHCKNILSQLGINIPIDPLPTDG